MAGWYALAGAANYSGLYCSGLTTARAACQQARLTLGSAADSAYEYMLKQWALSGRSQALPLALYKDAMAGMRR